MKKKSAQKPSVESLLILNLEKHFKKLKVPNIPTNLDDSISEYKVYGEYFSGKHWQDVNFEDMKNEIYDPGDAGLLFLPLEAAACHLPAYLRTMLMGNQDFDAEITSMNFIKSNFDYLFNFYDADQLNTLAQIISYMGLYDWVQFNYTAGQDVWGTYGDAQDVLKKIPTP